MKLPSPVFPSSTALLAASSIVSSVTTFSGVFSARMRRPSSAFVPSSLTMGSVIRPLYGREQPPRHLVAARYAAEDVEEHALDLLVGGDDIQGGGDLLGVGPATDVAEVGGLAAGLGDDVERAHHEPRPVAEDADVAIELDVLQPDLLRPFLLGSAASTSCSPAMSSCL